MEIGFIGLGRMGRNIVTHLIEQKINVVAYNRSPAPLAEVVSKGAAGASSLEELAKKLKPPRTIWIMVTAGKAVDVIIGALSPLLQKGDILIDGGNSFYKDSIRRAEKLAKMGIDFLDVGTSGGLYGAAHGACLTVGGKKEVFDKLVPIFNAISAKDGCSHVGSSGAGHFVKMVHNGIEYALLQSYAEGFEQLNAAPYELDLKEIARVWNRGSVIRSWLLELAQDAFAKDPRLEKITGEIGGGETGRWALETAKELQAPYLALAHALSARADSARTDTFANRFVAALRKEFGGHEVKERNQ